MTMTSLPPRSEHDQSLRKSVNLLVGLIRFRAGCPAIGSAFPLDRGVEQCKDLPLVYGIGAKIGSDGLCSLPAWCATYSESLERGLGHAGRAQFSGEVEAHIPFEALQGIALALGELVVDALERSFYAGKAPRIEFLLEKDAQDRISLKIRDALPSFRLPPMAARLAASIQGELHDSLEESSTERILAFNRQDLVRAAFVAPDPS
jgi:hypothetical protein